MPKNSLVGVKQARRRRSLPRLPNATAVDLFSGAGGLTRGLLDAGIFVAAGYDIDEACKYPYEHNNTGAKFYTESVTDLTGETLAAHYPEGHIRILVGCAPCQTFSRYMRGLPDDDPKWTLLNEFTRLIRDVKPHIVSMENVPELQLHPIYADFLSMLAEEGFHFTKDEKKRVVYCPDYGLPQQRSRLVLVASRLGSIEFIAPSHTPDKYRSVADTLRNLPAITAGETCATDPLHRSSKLSKLNLKRIKRSAPGGTWRDWPEELRAKCHLDKSGETYPSVYGRMEWDKPAPTVTTQFFGYGNGRFGHPEQDRAISLREGALLQSFPEGYQFFKPGGKYSIDSIGRMVGNAVPVRLGEAIGRTIRQHLIQVRAQRR